MKILSLFALFALYITSLHGQQNATQTIVGERPYELSDELRDRKSTFDFLDIDKWQITSEGCQAVLSRTSEQIVTAPYSGKIVYETEKEEASFYVSLKQPLSMPDTWDSFDLWTFGDHWLWGDPPFQEAMHAYMVVEDAAGEVHEVNLVQSGYGGLVHKYWMLNHVKFQTPFDADARFLGIRFKGSNTKVGAEHTIYLSSGYLYKEELEPLTFKPFPTELPFPLREETMLPTNFSAFSNRIEASATEVRFVYKGSDGELAYTVSTANPLSDISVEWNGEALQTITNRKLVLADGTTITDLHSTFEPGKDTVWFTAAVTRNDNDVPLTFFYTINQKTLIAGIEQHGEEGIVAEVYSGEVDEPSADRIAIPFLKYDYNDRPTILVNGELFTFMAYDFYHTNASRFNAGRPDEQPVFSGGKTVYIPKTDGKRNPVREKLFITVSPDVQEVLPTIDNPPSPMRSMQADRLWAINGGSDLEQLGKYVTDLRRKGVERVSIRYHEEFWREGGESYTFKLTPNPQLGVKRIQDYVQFVKDNDWRVGLYSNYTDMAPVNALWNADRMKHGPNGEWQVSWSRCYSPKPQVAWEQQAILAPQIAELFNTNHSYCDVHTAVSPASRVDYDYRVPDAGMMRGVIARYGMLLMNERKAYNGPVFSEGANHWWYAGLVDGNYANDDLLQLPVFPDFQLLKIHPLEMDAGNRGEGKAYLAYTLAYGNIGILSEGLDAIRRYAFLQPIQDEYVMRKVASIEYADGDGVFVNSSQAIIKKLLAKPRLKIVYETGLEVYVNFDEQVWETTIDSEVVRLPKYGFYAFKPGSNLLSTSVLASTSDKTIDKVKSTDLYYLNTHGERIMGELGGKGEYLLKKEKFGWEIIPLTDDVAVEFDLTLLNLANTAVLFEALDKEGNRIRTLENKGGKVAKLIHTTTVDKYRIIPAYK